MFKHQHSGFFHIKFANCTMKQKSSLKIFISPSFSKFLVERVYYSCFTEKLFLLSKFKLFVKKIERKFENRVSMQLAPFLK